jgi:hypothetical protein
MMAVSVRHKATMKLIPTSEIPIPTDTSHRFKSHVILWSYIRTAVAHFFEIFQSGLVRVLRQPHFFNLCTFKRSHQSDLFSSKTYDVPSLLLGILNTCTRRHTLVSCWSAISPLSSFPALAASQQRLFPRRRSIPTRLSPYLPTSLHQRPVHQIWSR